MRIQYPQIIVYSAAAAYNVKGSMFPKKEYTFTGKTKLTMVLVETAACLESALMDFVVAYTMAFGPFALPFIASVA
ncbi:MAG: hypothetical protein LBN19_03655 [Endomicrobium sp.]|nr:hypothetical protein [Endomicrobium sp.]